jgi:hypothetical protein
MSRLNFQSRKTRLALLFSLTTSIVYLSTTLGILVPPSGTPLDLDRHWDRITSSLGFERPITYIHGVGYVAKTGKGGRHPIEDLLARGRDRAAALEAKKRGIQTFEDAVRDYREEFGMEPPEGFDQWWVHASLSVGAGCRR